MEECGVNKNRLVSFILFLYLLGFISNVIASDGVSHSGPINRVELYQFTDIGRETPICHDMLELINSEIKKYKRVRFEENNVLEYSANPIFIKGIEVKNIELNVQEHIDHMGNGVGKIYRYDIDIDNDGEQETTYKIKSYRSSAFTDLFYIYEPGNHPAAFEDGMNYKELNEHADLDIILSGNERWRADPHNNKWAYNTRTFLGQVGIYPFIYKERVYLTLSGPKSIPREMDQFYIGEILPDEDGYKRIHDLCYFTFSSTQEK